MRAQEFIKEISDEKLQDYLSRASQRVDSRMTRMAQARDRLNKGYEIYHAETPDRIVHRFDARTPVEAQRYYADYIDRYESDRDYDLRLRRATGIMEDIEDYAGMQLRLSKDSDGVAVRTLAGGRELGMAEFFFDDQGRLDPQTVWVDERYHGQGIAAAMYDYLKDKGYTIVRSWDQTDAGRGFWDKHRGEEATVWENFADGIRAYHGNQGGIDTEQLHAPMWFTASRPDAEYYAGNDGYVVVVDLDIQNPYVLQPGEEANSVLRRWQELQAQGYDGIYDRRLGDWIPFSRKQIRVISKDDTFIGENFADGKVKGKSRPGRVKRAGASCSGSVTDLRAKARKYGGEKGKMYHWCANMKSGRRKTNESSIGTLHYGPITITIDDHAIDRAIDRDIDPKQVDQVLKRIPSITDQLDTIHSGERFWIYSPALQLSLGLRRISDRYQKFVLKTLYPGQPMDLNVAGIIEV